MEVECGRGGVVRGMEEGKIEVFTQPYSPTGLMHILLEGAKTPPKLVP